MSIPNKVAQGSKVAIPIKGSTRYGQTPAGGFASGGTYRWEIRRTDDTIVAVAPLVSSDAAPNGWSVEILNLSHFDNQPYLDLTRGQSGFTNNDGVPGTLIVTPPSDARCEEYSCGVSIDYPQGITLAALAYDPYFTICFSWSSAPTIINVPVGGIPPIVGVKVSNPAGTSFRGRPLNGFGFNLLGDRQYISGSVDLSVSVDTTSWAGVFPAALFQNDGQGASTLPTRTFQVVSAGPPSSNLSLDLSNRAYPLLDLGPFLVTFNYAPVPVNPPPPPPPQGGPALRYREDAQHAPAWVTRTYSKDQNRLTYTTKDAGATYQSAPAPIACNDLSLLISPQSGANIVLGSATGQTYRTSKFGDAWDTPTAGGFIYAYGMARQHPTDRQRVVLLSRNYSADDTVAGTVLRSSVSYDGGKTFGVTVAVTSLASGDTPETTCAVEWIGDALIICTPTQTPSTDFLSYFSMDGAQTWKPTLIHSLPALAPTFQFVGLSSAFVQGVLYLSGFNYILGADGLPTGKIVHRLISTGDFGATWKYIATLPDASPYGLGSSARTGRLLWGLTYYSDDAGATWRHV
jgi:hypothetical protein